MNIGILITNPNHHLELTLPVATRLVKEGVDVKYISLCELRRMHTPVDVLEKASLPYVQMKALAGDLKPSTGSKSLGDNNSLKRKVLRKAFWLLKLRKFISGAVKGLDKVLLMNDAAFPGDMICDLLHKKNIPFYLMQEGIRFPLPNEVASQYGGNGAVKVLAWGEHSAAHFISVKQARTEVVAVGSPRIDRQYAYFQNNQKDGQRPVLGIFTNPIDDMGYTSFDEKLGLVRDFAEQYSSFISAQKIEVFIKTHPREDPQAYLAVVRPFLPDCMVVEGSINDAIRRVDVGVIMASTVGLELMIAGKQVIQLKLPRYGYVFDYVSNGPAKPVDELSEAEFNTCFDPATGSWNDYLSIHFANLGKSEEAIVKELIG